MSGLDGFYRVCVKLPATRNAIEDDAATFVPIFHEWIREGALDLVMLDVADYAHAPDSPGIMLVCHEVSFSLDRTDGDFGLLAQRRRPVGGSAEDAVAVTLGHALEVAERLQADRRVADALALDRSTVRFESNDRLRVPNSEEGYETFAPVVAAAMQRVMGGEPTVERIANDPRDRLAVRVRV